MAKIIFPNEVMKGFFINSNIYSTRDDEEYYLCFGKDGLMFAMIYYSPNKMYSRGYWSKRIEQSEFKNHFVEGKPLTELICEKLLTILPSDS